MNIPARQPAPLTDAPDAHEPPRTTATSIALLGLGPMGSALGHALLRDGHDVTVWNRTAARTAPLQAEGAVAATSVADAITASPVTLICLRDSAAVEDLLGRHPDAIRGRAIINLSSSTPDEARRIGQHVTANGGAYLDGAVMVPTPLVGHDDALVIFSGDRTVLDQYRPQLASLAGRLDWLGDDPGLAAVHDLGMLDLYLTGMAGFLHAAALVQAEGVRLDQFLPYAIAITDVLRDTLAPLADEVGARHYPGDEDTTEMELRVAEHILGASGAKGVGLAVPRLVHDLLADAIASGYGASGFASIYEQFAAPTPTP